jgi:acylglycerol lipase
MKEQFWTNQTGTQIRSLHWPVEQPRAVIALIHGQGEHIGRYDHLAHWFNQSGVAVMGYDQQGFGKSGGPRGHAASIDAYLRDVDMLLQEVEKTYPDVPVFLYGHSMGGNVVLNYTLRRQTQGLAGIIATGPWIRLAFTVPSWKLILGRLLRSILPTLTLRTELEVKNISSVQAVVDAYNADPLVHDKVSAAGGIALTDAAQWLNSYHGKTPTRVLLQHGTADKLTSMPANREFAARLEGDVTFREWDGFFHEIHNESAQKDVFQYTLGWMKV